MQYNELKTTKQIGKTRVGRGISAGGGKTAGRGTKGQGSRKSGGVKPGFEGGQQRLMQRLPKLAGFKSLQPKAVPIYTGSLKSVKGDTVDNFTLAEAGLLINPYTRAKLVVRGGDAVKKTVALQGISANALARLQKAGGTFKLVATPSRSSTKTEK